MGHLKRHVQEFYTDEERDRLIRHNGHWIHGALADGKGGGCMMGVAYDLLDWRPVISYFRELKESGRYDEVYRRHYDDKTAWVDKVPLPANIDRKILPSKGQSFPFSAGWDVPFSRYNRLCKRFGEERIGRLIKQAAAEANNKAIAEMLKEQPVEQI